MFGVGFALAVVAVWLIDSAVQGRHPIKVLESIIQQPTNARATLAEHKGELSPTQDANKSYDFWQQVTGPLENQLNNQQGGSGGSSFNGPVHQTHGANNGIGNIPGGYIGAGGVPHLPAVGTYDSHFPSDSHSGGDSSNPVAKKAVSYAEAQIGKKYLWGGSGPNRFDCSGLMYAAYKAAGKTIPRTTSAMLASPKMTKVSRSQLQPGDIIFPYVGHCFMYVGNGRCVEAPHTGTTVRYTNIYAFMTARRPK